MPWSSFSECWALSQLFHSPLWLSYISFTYMQTFVTEAFAFLQGLVRIIQICKTFKWPFVLFRCMESLRKFFKPLLKNVFQSSYNMLIENMSFSDNYSLCLRPIFVSQKAKFFWKIIKVPISLMSLILGSLFLSFISICYKSTFWVLPLFDQRHLCEWYLFPLFFPNIFLPSTVPHTLIFSFLFVY